MNEPRYKGLIKPLHSQLQGMKRAIDNVLIFLALLVSLKIYAEPLTHEYMLICLIGIVIFSLFAENQEIYHTWRGAPMFDEALRILWSWLAAVFFIASVLYFFRDDINFQVPVLELWLPLAPLAIILLHTLRRGILSFMRMHGFNISYYAILGGNTLGWRLKTALSAMPWLGYRFVGFFDDRVQAQADRIEIGDDKITGDFKDLLAMAQQGAVDHIYITLPLRAEQRIIQLAQELADSTVSVNIVPDFFIFNLIQSKVSNVQGIPVVSLFDTPFNAMNGATKRIEDLLLCAIILPLIALPMLIIAIAIKLTSPGPVIFRQKRYGIKGERIEVWKFRSMTVCENGENVKQATSNDVRVTPLGSFLRRTSLDELPQFLNVLQGSMSVVGPRPHAIAHNEFYRKQIQGYMMRHKVKPGITGQAQINGCRGETETIEKMEARIHHDLEYIRHWSLWLDLKIVFLTVFKGFTGSQVY
ncbi:undecaprenyl-phosphate glucose phosphotransferase [Methylomonas paludis]|uniref:Undecaprenyl-phosphate glucose phosphotransferase n=1 Tax=Methylomonas paludis TaxID=1173101 RepID=A0A975MN72_9GAMM|nr:undecaprenyl-phosphate glucose phosphotransferase [Methylomonas paludis]QWF70951.1 undecaprenyl-phosphate glucose phosphotransferase [Methylomonas paludis]